MFRLFIVAVTIVMALGVAPALAGKGGRNAPVASSIVLDQSSPALGSTVTFTTAYSGSVKNPRVQVMCYQNDALVYADAESAGSSFVLGGSWSQWLVNGGPAHCQADLYNLVWNGNNPQQVTILASTTFAVTG
jgi:hypothetical protein